MTRVFLAVVGMTVTVGPVSAQDADVLTRDIKAIHDHLREDVVRSAERMPSDHFGFRPAPGVETFGEVVGHIATNLYVWCAAAGVESNPHPTPVEETASDKTALVEALKTAYAYCEEVLGSLNDDNGRVRVAEPHEATRLSFLVSAVEDTAFQYGRMATYMRISGLVPASSDRPETRPAASVLDPQPPDDSPPILTALEYRFPTQDNVSIRFRRNYVLQAGAWGQVSAPSRDRWVSYDEAEPVILDDAERFWRSGQFESLWVDVTDRPFENGVVGRLVVFNFVERAEIEPPTAVYPTPPAPYLQPPTGYRRVYPVIDGR